MNLESTWDREFDSWNKKLNWGHHSDMLKFQETLGSASGKVMLDIGCGDGFKMDWFSQMGAKVTGIDISRKIVEYNRSLGRDVIRADARNLPFNDNTFDIVYSMGVVEHFKETEKAIREHFRVAKPKGKVIIQVPYKYSLFRPLGYLWYLSRGMLSMEALGKAYSKPEIRGILESCGGSNIELSTHYTTSMLHVAHLPFNECLSKSLEGIFPFLGLMIWSVSWNTGAKA